MKNKKIEEDGEGGGGDGGVIVGGGDQGITAGGEGMGVDILGGGSGEQTQLGVLGVGNFQFPVRLGKIKKRLLEQYALLKK